MSFCLYCGAEFNPKRKTHLFCSVNCNKKYYWLNNKNNISIKRKQYYKDNLDKFKEYNNNNKEYHVSKCKEWHSNNKDKKRERDKEKWNNIKNDTEQHNKFKESRREYYHSIKNNPTYKLKKQIRSMIQSSFRRKNYKKSNKTEDILGCSIQEFKSYIESLFCVGMSWENYGPKGWHLDHIIPLAYATSSEDIKLLCNYTNFQPLWAADNHKKGSKQ